MATPSVLAVEYLAGALLRAGTHVLLTGPAGCGKSRLAASVVAGLAGSHAIIHLNCSTGTLAEEVQRALEDRLEPTFKVIAPAAWLGMPSASES